SSVFQFRVTLSHPHTLFREVSLYTGDIRFPSPSHPQTRQCIPSQSQGSYIRSDGALYYVSPHGIPGLSRALCQTPQPSSVYRTADSAAESPDGGNNPD